MKKTFGNAIGLAIVMALAMFAAGCATSEKIQSVQAGDQNLSCDAIKGEFAKLDKATADIESKKGATGTNVAAAVLWLPGLAYTYYDASEATKLIYDRRSSLTSLFNNKKCSTGDTAAPSIAQPAQTAAIQAPGQTAKAEPITVSMTAIEVQKQLFALGYKVGTPDGVIGKKTVDALKKFQRENGLTQSGKADTETVAMLQKKSANSSTK